MRVLVTGVAGFIGFHVAKKLLERGDSVVGIDNLNDYYDPALKIARLRELGVTHTSELFQALEQAAIAKSSGSIRTGVEAQENIETHPDGGKQQRGATHLIGTVHPNVATQSTETILIEAILKNKPLYSDTYPAFQFRYLNLEDREGVEALFDQESFDGVCHLAAQAGVRYSLTNPMAYVSSNLVGFAHLLEGVRRAGSERGGRSIQHFVYASSSSVYGLNTRKPFRIQDTVDHPVSFYAATKKSNELMAHAYSHLFGIPTTGLRFFTVYGPWGRPDMAYFLFTKAILEGQPITLHNYGNMRRDFTYIDDIVEGVVRVLDRPARPNPDWSGENPDPASSPAPYRVYNLGFGNPVGLLDLVETIEKELGIPAQKILKPMPAGDVPETYADTTDLEREFGYRPRVDLRTGIPQFVRWYRQYYNHGYNHGG